MAELRVSIGICAYNEEANIGRLLQGLQSQQTEQIEISQIIVVASGCTDRTAEIVRSQQQTDPRVTLIEEPERRGKASAINLFLQNATGEICVLESADTVPERDTIEHLCLPFLEPNVGMTGGRPIPTNDRRHFWGFTANVIWELHHRVASIDPKLGELVAFRNIVAEIPIDTPVDEASIEQIVRDKGYQIKYVPQARVLNKGPENLSDFLSQRRRIYCGHLYVRRTTRYQVSTMNSMRLAKLAIQSIQPNLRSVFWTAVVAMLELWARFLGMVDFYGGKKKHYVWKVASSTKAFDDDRSIDTDSAV